MPLISVTPFAAASTKSGVSFTQGESRGRTYFRLGLTEEAQTDLFGRQLKPGSDALAFTLSNDKDHRHLLGLKVVSASEPDAIPLGGGARNSVSVKLTPWRQAAGKRPAVSLLIVNRHVAKDAISVKLPDWARPEVVYQVANR